MRPARCSCRGMGQETNKSLPELRDVLWGETTADQYVPLCLPCPLLGAGFALVAGEFSQVGLGCLGHLLLP